MYAARARIAKPATSAPSISLCGSWRMISRSLQLPGSDSSALMTRKLGRSGLGSLGMKPHLVPVGKPAPPRPRRPEAFITSMILSCPSVEQRLGVVPIPARARGVEPPRLEAVEVGEDAVLVSEHAPRPPKLSAVIRARTAGIQTHCAPRQSQPQLEWIPAFAGMTEDVRFKTPTPLR